MLKLGWVMWLLAVLFCGWTAALASEPPKTSETPELTVDLGPPVHYKSDNGDLFIARYGSLSDGSLEFVKVETPEGQKYTLPRVLSGSGVKYTDERQFVWWLHQGKVRIDIRDAEGNWKRGHLELRKVQQESALPPPVGAATAVTTWQVIVNLITAAEAIDGDPRAPPALRRSSA